MQYRISALVAIFSASTALAYLDCGGGRAPPKTTVPGCPGYVDPATAVPTSAAVPSSTAVITPTTTTTSAYDDDDYYTTTASGYSDAVETKVLDSDETGLYTVYEDPDGLDGCYCSGYLCEYAMPGCVDIDTTSTITANPGWETKTFNSADYYSYIKTASSGGELSIDGYRIVIPTDAPESTLVSSSKTKARTTTSSSEATGTVSSVISAITTMSTSTVSAHANSTISSTASGASNATVTAAPQASVVTANQNSASRVSGMASLVALLVSGAAAVVLL